jgi:hypothetical protein
MTDEQILLELQKINKKLDIFSNPFRNAGRNFTSGVFHSLGNLFGTVIVAGILIYIFSQLNLTQRLNDYIKSLIPTTQIKIENPFSMPSSDQL